MEELELDERKTKILDAIIRNYLETGEPVGSRTISKYTDLNLSSADDPQRDGGSGRIGLHRFSRTPRRAGFRLTRGIAFMWIT